MKINLSRLANNFIEKITISEIIVIDEEYLKNTEIRKLSELKVEGFISSTDEEFYVLNLKVKGEMILPCSITLEDVAYPFNINIDEALTEEDVKEENFIKIINKSIDIIPIIWQNIVMEVPLKVTSQKAESLKLRGEGWELIKEDENKS